MGEDRNEDELGLPFLRPRLLRMTPTLPEAVQLVADLMAAVQEKCARAVERGLDLSGTDFRGNGLLRSAAKEIREHLYDT